MAGSSDSSGNWLMTYADFITLMMIFFIVLYTFTPGVEKSKFQTIIGAFKKSQGLLSYNSVVNNVSFNVQQDRAKSWQEFEQYIEEEELSDQVQLDLIADGIKITLGESVSFDTYSAKLKQQAREILLKIGENLKKYTAEDLKEFEIQGHTDNRPVKQNARLYKTNWELGAARATSVLHYLIDHAQIEPKYLKASTYGPYHPRSENQTKRGRQKNRRVEMYIRYKDQQKIINPEQAQKESKKSKPIRVTNVKRGNTN